MKTPPIATLILSLASSMSMLHGGGLMIDDFEHSNETAFGAIRTTRYGYVTVSDQTEGMLTGSRGGYLLSSTSGAGPGVGWDGHCLLYQGSAETNARHKKDGSALFSISYNRTSGRGIPKSPVDFQGNNIEFSLANQKRLEVFFRECNTGVDDKLDLYLRIGDADAKFHEIKMIKLPGSGAVSFPLAPFIEKGLNLDRVLGVEVLFGDSVSPGDGVPLGVDFKIEHIRTIDTDTMPDSDSDGKSDLVELVTGSDPLSSETHPNANAPMVTSDENGEAIFTYRTLATLPAGITTAVEFSTDLVHWSRDDEQLTEVSSATVDGGLREIKIKSPSALPQAFFRINIQKTITPINR